MSTIRHSAWEARLESGLRLPGIAPEITNALITALGDLGCEAEFGLRLTGISAAIPHPTRAQGEAWLQQIAAFGQRLARVAERFHVAAGSIIAMVGSNADVAEPWWPATGAVAPTGEPIDIWLRRAGFPLRHIVSIGLPEHVEALTEALDEVLHALHTLPPSGVVTHATLAAGLDTLATAFGGDLIPHHVRDLDATHAGLVTGALTIARLPLAASSIEGDLRWAEGELARARMLIGGTARITHPLPGTTGNLWAQRLIREWEHTLAILGTIRTEALARLG
jgi:hypothetical protein